MQKQAEFSEGQHVTFNPYGKPVSAIVKAVGVHSLFNRDEVNYRLSGDVDTITTGRSIEESKHFESHETGQ